MEVFAVLDDGELWNRYWDRMCWHQWESLGGELDPGGDAGRLVLGRRPARRLRPRRGRPDVAPLVGRDPVGPLGAARAQISRR